MRKALNCLLDLRKKKKKEQMKETNSRKSMKETNKRKNKHEKNKNKNKRRLLRVTLQTDRYIVYSDGEI